MKKFSIIIIIFLSINQNAKSGVIIHGNDSALSSGDFIISIVKKISIEYDNHCVNQDCFRQVMAKRDTNLNLFRTQSTTKYLINNRNVTVVENKNLNKKPPLNPYRITCEVLAGGLGGFGFVYLESKIFETEDWGEAYALAMGGYLIGCTLGVYLVGNIGNETGSLRAPLVGSLMGAVLSYFVSGITKGSSISSYFFIISPPIGATYTFNHSRQYKSSSNHSTAIIHYQKGIQNLAFPVIYPESSCGYMGYSMDIVYFEL